MRIAINTRFLLPGKLEGLGWYTYEICRRLVEQHPEDEFFFLFDRPFSREFVMGPNVQPLVLSPPARHPWLWYLWFEWAIPRALKKIKPDLFFSPDGYLSLAASTPTVLVLHDLAFLHYPEQVPPLVMRYYKKYTPRFLAHAHKTIAVSEFVKQDILSNYPVSEEQVQVIPNGCRTGFTPLPEAEKQKIRSTFSQGDPYFFYLGALHPRKNLPRLIRAFTQFRKQTGAQIRLLIGGRIAWQTGEIFQEWKDSAFKEDIHFTGYLSEEPLRRVLAASFALTYLSLFEGFGLPILEAMHCEVPVITSNTTSMPEVAGDAAILVNPHREEEIVAAMKLLWEYPELRASLIEKGRQQRKKFSWDRAAESVYALFEQVLNEKSAETENRFNAFS